jgi:GT2 family glycosyltransferase
MDSHPQVGIAGGLLMNGDGGIERSAHRRPSPLGEFAAGARLGLVSKILARYVVSPPMHGKAHECDWVSGACMIIRFAAIKAVGPMDDGFFLYYEEVDFSSRVRAAGWSVWYVPEAKIMHLEGAATGIRNGEKRRPAYWYDSRRRFFVKHNGVFGLMLTDLLWGTGRLMYELRRLLAMETGKSGRDPKWYMWDLLWGDLRAILNGRAWNVERVRRRR